MLWYVSQFYKVFIMTVLCCACAILRLVIISVISYHSYHIISSWWINVYIIITYITYVCPTFEFTNTKAVGLLPIAISEEKLAWVIGLKAGGWRCQLLPRDSYLNIELSYSFRTRKHNWMLPQCTTHLFDSNFIYRAFYSDIW